MPKNDALARRRPNGDGGRWQLHTARGWKLAAGAPPLGGSFARIPAKAGTPASAISSRGQYISPDSPRRSSPTSSAWRAPWFAAICNPPATRGAAGIPPILKWRALLGWLSGNGDRHPTGCMRLRPGILKPGASPPFWTYIASLGGGRILERKEDLRPTGRWIQPPTEVVISICNLMQFYAILRKCQQFHAISRKPMQIPASYSKTEELPFPKRKPLCEMDLHRWIRPSFRFQDGGTRRRGDAGTGDRGTRRQGDAGTSRKRRAKPAWSSG